MATTEGNTPRTGTWELTAPESWVLLNGAGANTQPFKLALTELLMRGALKIVESKGRFMGKTVLLTDGPKAQAPSEASLLPVWELYRGAKTKTTDQGTGVPIKELAKAAHSKLGTVGAYGAKYVLPGLRDRGLFEWQAKKVLFIFNSGSWVLTPAGQAKKAELQGILDQAQANMGGWVTNDPTQAVAFMGTAGAAILLAPTLFPQLKQLGEVADAGDFDFGNDFDFDSLDSMDTAFDAIDSSVDSGVSDSGGSDSGGSDSGGSSD